MIQTAKLRDIEIAYEITNSVTGEGEPLLLIAGLGYGQWFWHKIVPALAERYKVITFDNRGAGQSTKAIGPYTIPMMVNDTLGLMDHLGLESINVLGHSLGGFIAQGLAVREPHRIGKLILASTGFGGPQMVPVSGESLAVLMNREGSVRDVVNRGVKVATAPGFAERNPEMVEALVQYRMSNPVPQVQYAAQVAAGASMSLLTAKVVDDRMAALKMPTLILFGDQDHVVPTVNAHLLGSKIKGSKIHLIPNTGHMFPLEAPEATVESIIGFLRS